MARLIKLKINKVENKNSEEQVEFEEELKKVGENEEDDIEITKIFEIGELSPETSQNLRGRDVLERNIVEIRDSEGQVEFKEELFNDKIDEEEENEFEIMTYSETNLELSPDMSQNINIRRVLKRNTLEIGNSDEQAEFEEEVLDDEMEEEEEDELEIKTISETDYELSPEKSQNINGENVFKRNTLEEEENSEEQAEFEEGVLDVERREEKKYELEITTISETDYEIALEKMQNIKGRELFKKNNVEEETSEEEAEFEEEVLDNEMREEEEDELEITTISETDYELAPEKSQNINGGDVFKRNTVEEENSEEQAEFEADELNGKMEVEKGDKLELTTISEANCEHVLEKNHAINSRDVLKGNILEKDYSKEQAESDEEELSCKIVEEEKDELEVKTISEEDCEHVPEKDQNINSQNVFKRNAVEEDNSKEQAEFEADELNGKMEVEKGDKLKIKTISEADFEHVPEKNQNINGRDILKRNIVENKNSEDPVAKKIARIETI